MRNALIELVGRSDTIGALKGCIYGCGRSIAERVEADAGKLVDSIAAAHDSVAEETIVEADAGENAGVDIRREAVRSPVEPGKLDSALFAGRGIDDVGIEAVVVVVFFRRRTIELIAQAEVEGEP